VGEAPQLFLIIIKPRGPRPPHRAPQAGSSGCCGPDSNVVVAQFILKGKCL
jgi:hypothetical protein